MTGICTKLALTVTRQLYLSAMNHNRCSFIASLCYNYHRLRSWHLKPLNRWWHNSHSTLCWCCHLLSGTNNESSTSDFLSSTDRPPRCPTDSHTESDITGDIRKGFQYTQPLIIWLTQLGCVHGAQSGVGCQKLLKRTYSEFFSKKIWWWWRFCIQEFCEEPSRSLISLKQFK